MLDMICWQKAIASWTRSTIMTAALWLHADGRWARDDFPWSADLAQANHDYFGNSAFRPNQREAINATLSRQDCFVLMPTGGGAPGVPHANSTAPLTAIFSARASELVHAKETSSKYILHGSEALSSRKHAHCVAQVMLLRKIVPSLK